MSLKGRTTRPVMVYLPEWLIVELKKLAKLEATSVAGLVRALAVKAVGGR